MGSRSRTAASSSAVTHEDPDRLAHVSQETLLEARCASGGLRRGPIFARGLEGFPPLAERSRYAITESHTAVVSEQVLLQPRLPCHPRNEKASVRLATFSCSGRGNCRPPPAAASTASRPLRDYPPRC
jgi:hypothetical protein